MNSIVIFVQSTAPEESKQQVCSEEAAPAIDESKLRRVSITTNSFLFMEGSGASFEVNERILELLHAMKNKYRLFLITQVSAEGSTDHLKAREVLSKLVDRQVVKEHRILYCATTEGRKSLVR